MLFPIVGGYMLNKGERYSRWPRPKSLPMMPIETRKINNAHKNKDDFTYINKGKQYSRIPRLSVTRYSAKGTTCFADAYFHLRYSAKGNNSVTQLKGPIYSAKGTKKENGHYSTAWVDMLSVTQLKGTIALLS